MEYVKANGWQVYIDFFRNTQLDEFVDKINSTNAIEVKNNFSIKNKKFKHVFHGIKSLPLFYDPLNRVNYLTLGFVYDSYGHLGFYRIEVRNNKEYIFIADKNYFKGKNGNIPVKIFNTCSVKYIIASSFHMDDKKKFILNYDNNNSFYQGIIPVNTNFIIDAEIMRDKETFQERISFGEEIINAKLDYNRLKIHRISFDEKKCSGILQGGNDHLFLYKLGNALGKIQGKI